MLITAFTLFGLIIVIYLIGQQTITSDFEKLEEIKVKDSIQRTKASFDYRIQKLTNLCYDWSRWDDTNKFISNIDKKYIDTNLSNETFMFNDINVIVFLDKNEKIIYSKEVVNKKERSFSSSLENILIKHKEKFDFSKKEENVKGIILLPQGPMLLSATPIGTTENGEEVNGSVVMGRFLDQNHLEQLEEHIKLNIAIERFDDRNLTSDYLDARKHLLDTGTDYIKPWNEENIYGYSLVKDIFGEKSLIVRISTPRSIYLQGEKSLAYLFKGLIVISFTFCFIMLFFLDKIILKSLDKLSNTVRKVTQGCDFSQRVELTGKDELGKLSDDFNEMLNALEESQLNIKLSNSRYKLLVAQYLETNKNLEDIIDFLPDATFVVDKDAKIISWNKAIEEMTGIKKKAILGKDVHEFSYDEYTKTLLIDLLEEFDENKDYGYERFSKVGDKLFAETYCQKVFDNKGAFLWAKASPLYNSKGDKVGAIESIRDISEHKKHEENMKKLSYNDSLTGVYNRRFFEEEVNEIEKNEDKKIGIIVCDVDGLKFINDTLGHVAGDRLIQASAKTIQKSIRQEDVLARIGGDEFSVLLKNITEENLKKIVKRIMEEVSLYNKKDCKIPLSLSIGYASNNSLSISSMFKEADNYLYREKIKNRKNTNSIIMESLIKNLKAREYDKTDTTERLVSRVVTFSKKLDLNKSQIDTLTLLAKFRDIGKVGISDAILFKEGCLNDHELKEMRRHPEIGYRVAKLIPELNDIADFIHMHHEWWNGEGYPLGIRGEEIPLECRIMAIIDAYDAMTHKRPYRRALNNVEAIEELKKNAGLQFDPYLVEKFIKIVK